MRLDKIKESLTKEKTLMLSILVLAIPAIIENIAQVLLGVVDAYFVSSIAEDAISGVGITNVTMNIYISFFLALGIGTTALVSRFVGSKEPEKSSRALKNSLILGGGIGVLVGFINLFFGERILQFLGASGAIYDYAVPYYKVVAVPAVFLCIMTILSSALRAAGDTKTPMIVALIANGINVVLDYLLIWGIGNFEGMGIVGAGLATTLSRVIGVLLLAGRLYMLKNKYLDLSGPWRLDKKVIKRLTTIGMPAAGEKLFMRTGQVIYAGLILQIGATAYNAHNIAGNIESFSYLPGMGFGIAAATLVGQSLGAKDEKKAKKTGLIAYGLCTVFMVLLGMFFFIFAPMLAGIFTDNPVTIGEVVKVLRLIALFQPMLAITLVISSGLQGAGDTKYPMVLTLIGIWGIRVVGVYVLGITLGMGLFGVWLSYACDITFRGILLMVRFIKGKWMNKLVFDKGGEEIEPA